VSFLFLTRGGSVPVSACMCVYTHAHIHTAHEVLDVSPGVGTRHLEGLENLDGLNLGIHPFVYVHRVIMCTYMLADGMRSWLTAFFFQYVFPSEKVGKVKEVNVKPTTQFYFESELHRPPIKGIELPIVIKSIKTQAIINRTDYRLEFTPKIWPAAHFVRWVLSAWHLVS